MATELITTSDGFAVAEPGGRNLISGKMLKFVNGNYLAEKTEHMPINTTLVALDVTTAWVKWAKGKPVEHRVTPPGRIHPERDGLPDGDQTFWEEGLNGEPADPWRNTRYLRLIDPNTGEEYTFITDSFGGRKAIGDLKDATKNVRFAHAGAVPVVQLGTTMMKTNFGPKPRPQFRIVGWKNKGTAPALAEITDQHHERQDGYEELHPSRADMDDEIPF
jgi:hypothetical protein